MVDFNGQNEGEAGRFRIVSRNDFVRDANETGRKRGAASIYYSIGECVAFRRRERGLSQKEMAFSLGVKLDLLQKYETGEVILTPDLLLRAAQVLDVEPSKFFVMLAQKRLAQLSQPEAALELTGPAVEETGKVRTALHETVRACDSLLTILDIIDVFEAI